MRMPMALTSVLPYCGGIGHTLLGTGEQITGSIVFVYIRILLLSHPGKGRRSYPGLRL
jgi:hypothetical protein